MNATAALLRATSMRFTALYYLPFALSLLAAGQARWTWLLGGAVYWFLHGLGTESLNRLADRVEDEVNRPERTALCHRVGFGTLRRAAWAAWFGVAAFDATVLVLYPDPVLAVLLVLALISGVNYSYGLRLSRNRYAAPVVLTFHFGGTFVLGWALARQALDTGDPGHSFFGEPLAFYAVGTLTLLALGGAKDLTDLAGDARIGYHSAWIGLLRRGGALLAGLMVASTYVLTALFVLLGVLPQRFWLWLVLAPAAVFLGRCLKRASSAEERLATRELFYQYWVVVLAVGGLLYAPGAGCVAVVAATLVFWWWATQRMHWSPGVRRDTVRALGRLAAGRPSGDAPDANAPDANGPDANGPDAGGPDANDSPSERSKPHQQSQRSG